MKLGLIQVCHSEGGSITERQDILLNEAEKCFIEGADLVFFPEAYQYVLERGIVFEPEALKKISGDFKEKCSFLAKKYHAYLVPWDYEIDENCNIYNMSYVLDRNGVEIGKYRKVQLTYGELVKRKQPVPFGLTCGSDFPVFELDFGKIGIMICYDNYFPESARCLALNGAQLILYPLFGDTLDPQWELKVRVRAIDNCVYVAPCRIDCTDFVFTGVIDPWGNITERLPVSEIPLHKVVETDLSAQVKTHMTTNPDITEDLCKTLLATRNPDAYGAITKKTNVPTWDEAFCGKVPH